MLNFFKKNLTEEQIKQMDETIAKFKKNPHQFRFTVIFFLTSLLFGLLSIYLLQQKFALLMQKNGKIEIREVIKNVPVPPEEKPSVAPSQEATDSAEEIKEDFTSWTFKKNDGCNILAPISPYKDINYSRNWKSYSKTAGDDFPNPVLNIFEKMELISFSNENNETNLGLVAIYCTDNTDKISVSGLKDKIASELEKDEELKQTSILESNEITMWNKDAMKIVMSGGTLDGVTYYATTTDSHLYLFLTKTESDDEMVKKDVSRIFNGIIFLD
jgi:hypothetical protein